MDVLISGRELEVFEFSTIVREGKVVRLSEKSIQNVRDCHSRLSRWGDAQVPIYGVNTGFGEMVTSIIPPSAAKQLQLNLVRSHASGGGPPFAEDEVRAFMLSRLNTLMNGYSGVSVKTVELLRDFLNYGIVPFVPSQGSLGASGDLAPLAHIALSLIGEGEVVQDSRRVPTATVMSQKGLLPLNLSYKEGLALINGTSCMTGASCLNVVDSECLLQHAIALSSIYIQSLKASSKPFDFEGNGLKLHIGQRVVARRISEFIKGSGLCVDHEELVSNISEAASDKGVVHTNTYLQNSYSCRAIPQILGPVLDTIKMCKHVFANELNSVDDNPLFFKEPEDTFHGAHFHGQYVAMYADFLNIALAEIGVLAERQVDRLLSPALNGELSDFLTSGERGLYCGFAGLQYLATSIASENIGVSAPASIRSIPSNGSNQDIVSMGLISSRNTRRIIDNVGRILSVLAICVVQASLQLGQDRFSQDSQKYLQLLLSVMGESHFPYRDGTPPYLLTEMLEPVFRSPIPEA